MKSFRCTVLFFTVFLLIVSNISAAEILTNESIISMVRAELGEALIISKVRASRNRFDVSVEGIKRLKAEGVGEEIIKVMIGAPDDQTGADYLQALSLKESAKYDEAIQILTRLADKDHDVKYRFALIDTLLEKSWDMKEAGNQNWKTVAIEGKTKLKDIYRDNLTNADYWILYSKLSAIVDRERNLSGGIKKALYYRPGDVKTLIIQGDLLFRLAKKTSINHVFDDESGDTRKSRARKAKRAYKSALKNKNLSDEQKAYVCYSLGELESKMFHDRRSSAKFWEQSVQASAESKWGALSKKRLDSHK